MAYLNCDWRHVEQPLQELVSETDIDDDKHQLAVYDTDAVMRGITRDEMYDRGLTPMDCDHLCTITYDGTSMSINFHQSVVDSALKFNPAEPGEIGSSQATDIRLLAPVLAPICDQIEQTVDVVAIDFAGLSARSIAHGGHLTDWEFTYEVVF